MQLTAPWNVKVNLYSLQNLRSGCKITVMIWDMLFNPLVSKYFRAALVQTEIITAH